MYPGVGDETLLIWLEQQLGHQILKETDKSYRTMGFFCDGELIGAALYHDVTQFTLELTFATTNKRWCTRKNISAILDYAFNQMNFDPFQINMNGKEVEVTPVMQTIVLRCAKNNKDIRKLISGECVKGKKTTGVGFKRVGTVPKAYDGLNDTIIYCMERKDCKWISKETRLLTTTYS